MSSRCSDDGSYAAAVVQGVDVFRLPSDVLTQCIAVYLPQRDCYRFFALCKDWHPLLLAVRFFTFQLETVRQFAKDEAYRQRVLAMLGYPHQIPTGEDNTEEPQPPPPPKTLHRKIRLHKIIPTTEQVRILLPYIDFICPIPSCAAYFEPAMKQLLKDHPEVDGLRAQDLLEVKLPFPQWYQFTRLVVTKQNNASNPEVVCAIEPDPDSCSSFISQHPTTLKSSLSGIKSIMLDSSNICQLKLLHGATLDMVKILGTEHRLDDLSALCNLHSVVISSCNSVIDVQSLAGCHSVHLSSLPLLTDVSSLVNVSKLSLIQLKKLVDIGMLGNVKQLYVAHCPNIAHFPKPAATQQIWQFKTTSIADLTGMERLQSLALISCNKVTDVSALRDLAGVEIDMCAGITDISMLGNVKNLYITDTKGFIKKYPIPVRTDQDWTFVEIDLSLLAAAAFAVPTLPETEDNQLQRRMYSTVQPLDLSHLDCLFSLFLYRCRCPTLVAIACRAHTVMLRECDDLVDVGGLAEVKLLDINMCRHISHENESVALLKNVEEVHLLHRVTLNERC